MDDLISRKTIKRQIETIRDCWKISPCVSPSEMKLYANVFNVVLQTISDCYTAFDKEKVIEELIKHKKHAEVTFHNDSTEQHFGEAVAYQNSIEIVEKGGIE